MVKEGIGAFENSSTSSRGGDPSLSFVSSTLVSFLSRYTAHAAALLVCFERRCMKSIFRGFSGGTPTLRLTFLEQEERCSLFSFIFSKTGAGHHRRDGHRGAESHRGRSAFHPHAGMAISNCHPRNGGTRGAHLLRTR